MAGSTPMDDLPVAPFVEAHEDAPDPIVIDIDQTDAELHGKQEQRHRDAILAGCEDNGVRYVIGLPRNARPEARIDDAMKRSRSRSRAWREMAKPGEER